MALHLPFDFIGHLSIDYESSKSGNVGPGQNNSDFSYIESTAGSEF
ncbi:hypothetical protein NPIL_620881, partial [Nephila pilipes]